MMMICKEMKEVQSQKKQKKKKIGDNNVSNAERMEEVRDRSSFQPTGSSPFFRAPFRSLATALSCSIVIGLFSSARLKTHCEYCFTSGSRLEA